MENTAVSPAPRRGLSRWQVAGIVVTLLLGAALRYVNVRDSVVDHPYRSDAALYYLSAYNLNTYGVYSRANTLPDDTGSPSRPYVAPPPPPDAFVTPGYPLFLALFVHQPPGPRVILAVEYWQALLGSLTLLLVFYLFRSAGYGVALSAMLLTAISPHQIDTSLFMITETWFTLLLLAALAAFAWHLGGGRRLLPGLLAAGALFGAAALTRPVLEFFPVLLVAVLFTAHPRRQALKGSAALLAGFLLLWLPWVARNEISLGRSGDPAVMIGSFTAGMYPDLEYDHNPASLGRPTRWDPRLPEITRDMGAALQELGRRLREHPGEELEWYLVGKPVMLWSWEIIEGGWDAYVYPVRRGNPYETQPAFQATHAVAYLLHWPAVLLAFCVAILAWLPRARQRLPERTLVTVRVVGLVLLYNTAVLMALAPFTRYSIPFLPLVFGLGSLGAVSLWQWLRGWRRRILAAAQ